MSSNKLMLLLVAVVLSGFFCAVSAMADIMEPSGQAYKNLTAIEPMAEGQAPKSSQSLNALSGHEAHFRESLPMQLQGPMSKISKASYKPSWQKNKKRKPLKQL